MRSFRIVDRDGNVKIELNSHDVVVVDVLKNLTKDLPGCKAQEKKQKLMYDLNSDGSIAQYVHVVWENLK